jgi:ATP-dependent DNA ligase
MGPCPDEQRAVFRRLPFDLLYLNGKDLRSFPLSDRKERLERLVHKVDSSWHA